MARGRRAGCNKSIKSFLSGLQNNTTLSPAALPDTNTTSGPSSRRKALDDDMKRERRQKKQKGQCSAKRRHAEAQNSSLLWRSDGNKLGKDRKRKSGTSYTPQDLIRLWKPEAPCCCLYQIFTGRAQILFLCWWANLHVFFSQEDNYWSSLLPSNTRRIIYFREENEKGTQ